MSTAADFSACLMPHKGIMEFSLLLLDSLFLSQHSLKILNRATSHYDCKTYFSEPVFIQKGSVPGKDHSVDFLINKLQMMCLMLSFASHFVHFAFFPFDSNVLLMEQCLAVSERVFNYYFFTCVMSFSNYRDFFSILHFEM